MCVFGAELTGEPITIIDLSDMKPELTDDGDFTIQLTETELENMLEIYFTLWEPVEDEPGLYFMLGLSGDVEISQDGTILTEFEGEWPGINGDFVCLYEISNHEGVRKFAIPAVLNDKDVDIIAIYDQDNPEGKIIGARPLTDENTDMAAKNLIAIKPGDRIQFLYYAEYWYWDDDNSDYEDYDWNEDDYGEWFESEEFIVGEELVIEMLEVNPGEAFLYGFLLVDIQQNEYYTDFIEVEFLD